MIKCHVQVARFTLGSHSQARFARLCGSKFWSVTSRGVFSAGSWTISCGSCPQIWASDHGCGAGGPTWAMKNVLYPPQKEMPTPLRTGFAYAYILSYAWVYAGLRSPEFCLRHTFTRGPFLNMKARFRMWLTWVSCLRLLTGHDARLDAEVENESLLTLLVQNIDFLKLVDGCPQQVRPISMSSQASAEIQHTWNQGMLWYSRFLGRDPFFKNMKRP